MASSVLLAELAINPLPWRLSWRDPNLSMWPYVDDLNVALNSMHGLLDALSYIREFTDDFKLNIADHKTTAWTNSRRDKQVFAEASGFEVEDRFSALREDWMLTKAAKPMFTREMKRLNECLRRLERARCLPLKPERLAPIISTGCLSLFDVVKLPTHLPYKPVSSFFLGESMRPVLQKSYSMYSPPPP